MVPNMEYQMFNVARMQLGHKRYQIGLAKSTGAFMPVILHSDHKENGIKRNEGRKSEDSHQIIIQGFQ